MSTPELNLKLTPASHPLVPLARFNFLAWLRGLPIGPPPAPAVDLFKWFPGVQSQEDNDCASFSKAQSLEIEWGEANQQMIPKRRSGPFLYAMTRKDEGSFPQDSGTTVADNATAAARYGVCSVDMMPNDAPADAEPSAAAMTDAQSCKAGDSAMVDWSNSQAVQSVLTLGKPVDIAIPVYQSFIDAPSNGIIPLPDKSKEQLQGYHGITVGGYGYPEAPGKFKILNQWGTGWAAGGFAFLDPAYPVIEAWTSGLAAAQASALKRP